MQLPTQLCQFDDDMVCTSCGVAYRGKAKNIFRQCPVREARPYAERLEEYKKHLEQFHSRGIEAKYSSEIIQQRMAYCREECSKWNGFHCDKDKGCDRFKMYYIRVRQRKCKEWPDELNPPRENPDEKDRTNTSQDGIEETSRETSYGSKRESSNTVDV